MGLLCVQGACAFLRPSGEKTQVSSELAKTDAGKLRQLGDSLEAASAEAVVQQLVAHAQVPIGSDSTLPVGSGSGLGSGPEAPPMATFAPNLRERIYEDSKRLGKAAESLLAIQSDINRVQTEVQGKVFDLETVRGFFATHQWLQAESAQCKEQLSHKDQLLASMGAELHDAEMTYQNATSVMEARMQELEAKAQAAMSEEKNVEAEYLGSRKSVLEDGKIRAENQELIKKLEKASDLAVQNDRDRKTIEQLENADRDHKQLVEQLTSSVKALQEQVSSLQESDRQKDAALIDHTQELKNAAKMAQDQAKLHIATAEHDKDQLKQANLKMADELKQLTDEKAKLKAAIASVQYQAVRKFEAMKATIGTYKDNINSLRESVSQNIVARKKQEAEVNRLTQMLIKSDAQSLKEALDRTKKELAEAHDLLKQTQVAKAKADADLIAEKSAKEAAQAIAANEKAAAQKARDEMMERVGQCQSQKQEELAIAQSNFEKCTTKLNGLSEEKCGERWRELNKESLETIEKCKVTEETLRTCTAEKEVLKSAATGKLCGGEGGGSGPGVADAAEQVEAAEAEASVE